MIKKRIAIVGCSHSDSTQPNEPWYMGFDKHCVDVHCYAMSGQGLQYQDFILKYLSNTCRDYYDAVIVQLSGTSRYFIPTPNPDNNVDVPLQFNLQNTWNAFYDMKPKLEWMYTTNQFKCSDNTTVETWLAQNGNTGMKEFIHQENTETANSICVQYGRQFIDFLPFYEKVFDNFFYFGWQWESDNNIGYDKNVHEFLIDRYGEFHLAELLDDTLHLTSQGNRVCFNEYIMNSKIGDYLYECGLKEFAE